MLAGFVSDENYVAVPDALLEFEQNGETREVLRTSPRGAIHTDLPPGDYKVTVAKQGFGSKRAHVTIQARSPFHIRLLSDGLLGYAWPKWVRSGDIAEFRVHSVESYRLTLWRYGLKKEFTRMIGWFDEHAPRAVMQTLPDKDFTQTGAEWNTIGYPKNFVALRTPAPERSGLYYFHAETDSGRFFSFPWVVAPTRPQAKIAVIIGTNTWNAYNNFGGRSNYINPTGLPAEPTVNSRMDLGRYQDTSASVWSARNEEYPPLSFDRPEPYNHVEKDCEAISAIRGRQGCHLAPTEWRLLAWLEREGFEYDVYSDAQLHSGLLDLNAYKTLIVHTHPEYWTKEQYLRVKEWVFDRGGKLLYLGGNGIDCEVTYPTESTMHCRTWIPNPTGALVVTDPDTGKTYDCRFHYTVESPAKLLGVVFTEPGIATGAPYRAVDVSHWIFADTGLKNGDVFGAESQHERCPGGASGHETDKRSPYSPVGLSYLAHGLNPDDGGAEIVYHETESGGAVFSVGSITWPACLLVDKAVSQMTKNVLGSFLKSVPNP